MSFFDDVSRWVERTEGRIDAVCVSVGLLAHEALVDGLPRYASIDGSPIDTGFFRANWLASINSPQFTVGEVPDGANVLTISRSFRSGLTLYLTNGVEYGPYLELGRSPQAPAGVVAPVVSAWPQIVQEAVRVNGGP